MIKLGKKRELKAKNLYESTVFLCDAITEEDEYNSDRLDDIGCILDLVVKKIAKLLKVDAKEDDIFETILFSIQEDRGFYNMRDDCLEIQDNINPDYKNMVKNNKN